MHVKTLKSQTYILNTYIVFNNDSLNIVNNFRGSLKIVNSLRVSLKIVNDRNS